MLADYSWMLNPETREGNQMKHQREDERVSQEKKSRSKFVISCKKI